MAQQMVGFDGQADSSVDRGSPNKLMSDSFFNGSISDITPGDHKQEFALCAQAGGFDLVLHSTPEHHSRNRSSSSSNDMNSLQSASQSFTQENQLDYAQALADEADAELEIKEAAFRARQRKTEVAKLNRVLASTRSPSGSVCSERSRSKVMRFPPHWVAPEPQIPNRL